MSDKHICAKEVDENIITEEMPNEYIEEELVQNDEKHGCNCEEGAFDAIITEEYETEAANCPHPHGVTCTRVHAQAADVSLPVKVKPYAKMGVVETRCCGEPAITMRHCPGPEKGCDMVITQTICARIPIEYGVTATAGEATITCRRMGEAK